jgi:hypothetical protein
MDSPEDLGDECEGCECVGLRVSWGMSRGSEGIGSCGWEVVVVGIAWEAIACVVERSRGELRRICVEWNTTSVGPRIAGHG